MKSFGSNIRFLREQAGLTQLQLADKLNVSRVLITGYEQERVLPPLPVVVRLSDIFKIDLDTLVRGNLGKDALKKDSPKKFVKSKDILAITVDKQGKENVELVNQKASAGYLSGYQDSAYISELPKLYLPSLSKNKTYRAFEITGDSMLPVRPKSIVVCEYLEDVGSVANGETCVVISRNEGIVYKRVFNLLVKSNQLLLVSDNTQYKPYAISFADVLEVWKKKLIITDEVEGGSTGLNAETMMKFFLMVQEKMGR
jgi:transcriptional regulator with XRE-family HTH domain